MKKILLAGLALAMTVSFTSAAGDEWMTDFEAAKKKAAAENKDLLVNFTGSDWCKWCIKLVDEVFKHDTFKTGVADTFVLVELDFPEDKSRVSEETQKQNSELQEKYSIQGFPTILLLDSDGLPYAQTSYKAGGPEKYLAHLDELRLVKTNRNQAFAAAGKLEGVAKAKALLTALEMIPEAQLSQYSEITGQIATLDPNDETGFVAAQKRKAAETQLEQDVMAAMSSGKANEALTKIDTFITDYKVTGEEKQVLLGMKMNPLLATKQFDKAAEVIDALIAAAPESEAAKFAKSFKPKLEEMKAAAANPKKNPPHGQPGHIHNE